MAHLRLRSVAQPSEAPLLGGLGRPIHPSIHPFARLPVFLDVQETKGSMEEIKREFEDSKHVLLTSEQEANLMKQQLLNSGGEWHDSSGSSSSRTAHAGGRGGGGVGTAAELVQGQQQGARAGLGGSSDRSYGRQAEQGGGAGRLLGSGVGRSGGEGGRGGGGGSEGLLLGQGSVARGIGRSAGGEGGWVGRGGGGQELGGGLKGSLHSSLLGRDRGGGGGGEGATQLPTFSREQGDSVAAGRAGNRRSVAQHRHLQG